MDAQNQQQYRHHLYHPPPPQLPSPSQLNLPYSRPSNTLPPIPNLPPNSTRYAPYPTNSSLAPIQGSQWPHRTSSSRDEGHPSHQYQAPTTAQIPPREPTGLIKRESTVLGMNKADQANKDNSEMDPMPSTSDFVKKLYKMLEDSSFQSVVAWGPQGDCFVVKDMNEFTKSILPRMFKHSNFASFVRQLNKYDFHKVKNTDDNQYGDQSWTFKHPDFHADRRDALENIKRKVPAQRKSTTNGNNAPSSATATTPTTNLAATSIPSSSPSNPKPTVPGSPSSPITPSDRLTIEDLKSQLSSLTSSHESLKTHLANVERSLRTMERNYDNVLVEMVGFQRSMVEQGGLVQKVVEWCLGGEKDGGKGRELLEVIGGMGQRQSQQQQQSGQGQGQGQGQGRQVVSDDEEFIIPEDMPTAQASGSSSSQAQQQQQQWNGDYRSNPGLSVYTVGQLMPKSSTNDWPFMLPLGEGYDPSQEASTSTASNSSASPKLRVRRSTLVPTGASPWTVPPRVLLVDDDAVSRKLSSKFLQVFGCSIDVAVDGVGAVNKMNLEKYDLVLMDIVMPNLDGVSATSLIRQFDHMTPIISMTSNSKPNEIMTYYSSGMNDILAKPFTKEGMLDMLEKHLMHLRVFQHLAKNIPRSVGIPPLSDEGFEQALNAHSNLLMAPDDSDDASSPNNNANHVNHLTRGEMLLMDPSGRITPNPLAGMGLTDVQYTMLVQNLVSNGEMFGTGIPVDMEGMMAEMGGEGGKRASDDPSGDGRDGKRARFELIE